MPQEVTLPLICDNSRHFILCASHATDVDVYLSLQCNNYNAVGRVASFLTDFSKKRLPYIPAVVAHVSV